MNKEERNLPKHYQPLAGDPRTSYDRWKEAPIPFGYRERHEELNKALREAIERPLPSLPRWQKLLIGLGSISFWLFFFWLLTIA